MALGYGGFGSAVAMASRSPRSHGRGWQGEMARCRVSERGAGFHLGARTHDVEALAEHACHAVVSP